MRPDPAASGGLRVAAARRRRATQAVLVVNVEARVGLAVVRSLGRLGYPVHAVSPRSDAIGLFSRFATAAEVVPDYDDARFIPWLREYCTAHDIHCIVPTEEFLLAIQPCFDEFATLLPMSHDDRLVYRGMSKADLFELLITRGGEVGAHLPPLYIARSGDAPLGREDVLETGARRYIKVDGCHGSDDRRSRMRRLEPDEDAQAPLREWLGAWRKVLVQRHVDGVGIGAFVLRWNGRVIARFMHRRLHELPGSGWSSFRESWWNEAVMRDAERKLEALGWQGVAMMEYRWDAASGEFALLEMNGRFWGSQHLAMFAGVDFAGLLLDAFLAGDAASSTPVAHLAEPPVRCRNIALELKYVVHRLRQPRSGWRAKLWVVAEFVLLSVDPRIKSDLWYPGDRMLYWRQWLLYAQAGLARLRGARD